MKETIVLLDGTNVHASLLDDLAIMNDHSYDIDELYTLYPYWATQGEAFVDQFSSQMYPKNSPEAEDDYIAMRNAMINLYCNITSMTSGLDPKTINHVAYFEEDMALAVTVNNT